MRVIRPIQVAFQVLPAVLLLMAPFAVAQQMTERHIPVGAYPYLKSESLAGGTIVGVNADAKTLTIEMDGSERSFRLTDATKIWLDRSRFGRTTQDGDLQDLATGLEVEVRSRGPGRPEVAYWVKVQIPPP